MKSKCLILVFLIFMMCGCTAEVNLDISDNKIKESVDITFYQNALYPKDIIKSSFRNYIPVYARNLIVDTMPDEPLEGINYYTKKETDLGNGYKFNYSYDFNINEYKNARTVKDGFRSYNISFNRDDHTISLFAEGTLLYFNEYPELEEVKLNIKTDYLVRENNADEVNGNVYTWILEKDDSNTINMLIDTSDVVKKVDNTNIIIIGSIIVVIIFIFLLLVLKNIKNNKI